ncbi:DeoR/GlpR family DNA-binding transcription regulator [Cohaesibacter intestini]|uniref:DeoR/GlpR family DNA-binding transcription regulator n=1 Tax=Cohaesibacter intestini TaxID=2211145 RepID=UPI0018E51DC1|nr:DeoR/GlpR family DNA-binding transcription regulator [Cohaesibacter intestini]
MSELALNNPLVRQDLLRKRLQDGTQLVAADLAGEFGISLDTIRRDLLMLEQQGYAQRVRGGAVPATKPLQPLRQRRQSPDRDVSALANAALPHIKPGMSLILDGGTTLAKLAERIEPTPDLLVITPSPVIATILLDKDIPTYLLGGRISQWGGVAVGREAERALADMAVDLAFLGVCGLDDTFGLSSDDCDEAALQLSMARAARSTAVICRKEKLGRKARHRVLDPDQLSFVITDADAASMLPFKEVGAEIIHV